MIGAVHGRRRASRIGQGAPDPSGGNRGLVNRAVARTHGSSRRVACAKGVRLELAAYADRRQHDAKALLVDLPGRRLRDTIDLPAERRVHQLEIDVELKFVVEDAAVNTQVELVKRGQALEAFARGARHQIGAAGVQVPSATERVAARAV